MRKLIYALLVASFCAVPVAAQITDDALMVSPFDTANGCRAVSSYMLADQKPRSGFLPMRVHSGSSDRVAFLAIYQASIYDVPTLSDVPSGALPPTTFSSGQCSGSLGDYQSYEYSTFAAAIAAYNSFLDFAKPHTYGPFATPRGTFVVFSPLPLILCN